MSLAEDLIACIISLSLLLIWHATGIAQQLLSRVGENQFLADQARQLNLAPYINVNPSSQGELLSPAVLKATVAAILAAVWLDSDKTVSEVRRVMGNMGLLH